MSNEKEIEIKISNSKNLEEKLSYQKELIYFYFSTNPDAALKLAIKTEQESKNISNLKLKLSIRLHLANAYYCVNERSKAISIYNELADLYKEEGFMEDYIICMSNIALMFYDSWLFNQSIYIWKYLLKNNELYKNENLKNIVKANLINAYIDKCDIFSFNIHELFDILSYYEKLNRTNEEVYGNILIIIIKYFLHHEKYEDAKNHCIQLQKVAEQTKNMHQQYILMCMLSEVFFQEKDLKKSISCAKKGIQISENTGFEELNFNFYSRLYEYSKQEADYKSANEYLEKQLFYEKKLLESKQIMQGTIGLDLNDNLSLFETNTFKKVLEPNVFELEKFILLENMKGDWININIDSIVSISSEKKQTKILFFNKKSTMYKISFQKIMELIEAKFKENHLFFHTNLRSEVVNLYWLHRYDKAQKKIVLNIAGTEYAFSISRSRLDELRKYLNS